MASRDFFFPGAFGDLAGSGTDDVDYWNDPEIIVDPINCMVVAVIPRSDLRVPELPPPRRTPRDRTQPGPWRVAVARLLSRLWAAAEVPGW